MDASAARRRAIAWNPELATLARLLSAVLVALVASAAAFVWIRRSQGSLIVPLPPAALFVAGLIVCSTLLLFRRACLTASTIVPRTWLQASTALALPSVIAVLAAGAISLGGSKPVGLVGLWSVVVAVEAAGWAIALRRPRASRQVVRADVPRIAVVPTLEDEFQEPVSEPLDDPTISQYMLRRRDGRGAETIEGWVRVALVARQRHATAHLAICPPLEHTPECYAELGDGPEGEVKVGQALPWGVRIDLKLDRPAEEPTTALVEFSIQDRAANDPSGD